MIDPMKTCPAHQEREKHREKLTAMLVAAQEEADEKGTHSLDTIMKDMDEVIARIPQ